MRHRIFIAINLPEDIKKKLADFQFKWPELPARWTKPENLHITLAFLGYLTDEELPEVIKITKEVAQRHQPFSINLNKILYGPPKMPYSETKSLTGRLDKVENRPPRMIWVEGACPELVEGACPEPACRELVEPVEGKKVDKLSNLKNDLENALSGSVRYQKENRPFSPHLTLGRIREWEFRQIDPEERPEVETDISLSFEVNSIEVMESQLKRGGPDYTVLESAPLVA